MRVSVLNGEPATPEDLIFALGGNAAHQAIEITPAYYDAVRIRAEVVQLGPNTGDFNKSGGMYIDVPVVMGDPQTHQMAAYGSDVTLLG